MTTNNEATIDQAAKPEVQPAKPAATPKVQSVPAGAPRAQSFGPTDKPPMRPGRGGRGAGGGAGRGGERRGGRGRFEEKEFDQRILDLARVTRVTKGGKRMRFRACVIIGDRKGRVGFGVAKGADVAQAVNKSTTQAKKRMITVPISGDTIPHQVRTKFAAAEVLIKPAPKGTGIKAGGAVRVVLEYAGVPNAVAKILGSNNKINNTKAAFLALQELKPVPKKATAEAQPAAAAKPAK